MRALSIRQPYAWLIVNAAKYPDPKLVENRSRPTKRRGQHFVHTGKKFDQDGYDSILGSRPDLADVMPKPNEFQLGGIVGVVDIVDCVFTSTNAWYTGEYAYVLENPIALPFFPCKGALGFFEVDKTVPTSIFEIIEKSTDEKKGP